MKRNDYRFKLTPAYCLYNGAAIIEQNGAKIRFMVENPEDKILQVRLKNAFENYLDFVTRQEDCDETFKQLPEVYFEKGNRTELRKYVSRLYEADSWYGDDSQIENEEKLEIKNKQEEEAAAVLLLDKILNMGREYCATDVHIEGNIVRFRINGRLETKLELLDGKAHEVVQRIKLLSGMNVIEKRQSQDGQFVHSAGNGKLFVRVSSVPVIDGSVFGSESIVMRLLDTCRIPLGIENLGFNQNQICRLMELAELRNGLVLFCGPTGAGKSTTAASMLLEVLKTGNRGLKIISLEDPPEYVIPGVCQIKIDEKNGNSFNKALLHVFRQDPDVIMIGEIRDEKSAAAAVRGALTGHLVFGTVHAGSTGECLLRLENLGVEEKLLFSLIKGVICQDLNFGNGFVELLADVAVPGEKFSKTVKKNLTEEELEELFDHKTNYLDAIKDSLNRKVNPFYSTKKNEIKKEA